MQIVSGHGQGYVPFPNPTFVTPHVLPVRTPGYLRRIFARVPARGWPKARLLREADHAWWAPWLDEAGIGGVDVARGLHFSHTVMAITAALDEQGVALVPRILVEVTSAGVESGTRR